MAYTTIDNPELFFQTKTYTGTGSSHAITFDGSENMQPDWVWIKNRQQTLNFMMWDSVRGTTKYFYSNLNEAEGTSSSIFTSFDSVGFTVDNNNNVNQSSNNIVAWNWKAGGSASSNSDGSITSSVSAGSTQGFSVVSYTGTGSAATVGHGLGAKPQVIFAKSRDSALNWLVQHKFTGSAGDGWTDSVVLNETYAADDDTSYWNDTEPTSSVFTVGTGTLANKSSDNIIAYCFAEKKGYSKFGSYIGNGNADGVFAYTGFKPAWVLVKKSSAAGDSWNLFDNKRYLFNPVGKGLFTDSGAAEYDYTASFDFLSNGFKLRDTSGARNASGATYIYMAFAEQPFVNSNGVPNNAR